LAAKRRGSGIPKKESLWGSGRQKVSSLDKRESNETRGGRGDYLARAAGRGVDEKESVLLTHAKVTVNPDRGKNVSLLGEGKVEEESSRRGKLFLS